MQRVTQVQEQVNHLQSTQSSTSLSGIWSPPTAEGPIKSLHLEITPYGGDVLKWQEFWDMFDADIHMAGYAAVDKLNYLRSKLTGEALESVAGYQLSNEKYSNCH